ncbi:MAG: zinc metallopeptidase [Deltaproteobacteria bacterium]|nr:zinc metallopeptidase [Deltaproteobacteria bacterium]
MASTKQCIGLLTIGEIPEIILKTISAHILGCYDLDSVILEPLDYPEYAFDDKRLQYNAAMVIERLESGPFHTCGKLIGVIDVDLYVPVFTHIFGEARQDGKCAVVSTYRLTKNPDGISAPLPLLMERIAKVALHELGHLFNLVHCMEAKCLMHFAGTLENLDRLPLCFCRYCSTHVRQILKHT